jgi:hypothetical protein
VSKTLNFVLALSADAVHSDRPRDLRHEPTSHSQTLGSWVRIPLETWMSVCVYCLFVVLSVFSLSSLFYRCMMRVTIIDFGCKSLRQIAELYTHPILPSHIASFNYYHAMLCFLHCVLEGAEVHMYETAIM